MFEFTSRTPTETRSAWFLTTLANKPASNHFTSDQIAILPNIPRLAQLMQLVFPDAKKELETQIQIDDPKQVEGLICQFLAKINSQCFPVQTDHFLWEDIRSLHPALKGLIPVELLGIDSLCIEDEDPIRLVVTLAEIENGSDLALENFTYQYPQFDELRFPFLFSHLPKALEKMELIEPPCYLSDLINMAIKATGTFFLDNSVDDFEYYESRGAGIEWSKENIAYLSADWQRAKPIYERAWELINWTREDKEERTNLLMEIILEAIEELRLGRDYLITGG